MDSKKGRSEMQLDAGATSNATVAGKGEIRQERETERKVPAMGKKAETPSVWRRDSTVKETRHRAPIYKLTIPVKEEDLDQFHKWWLEAWDNRIVSMEQETAVPSMRFTDDVSPEFTIEPISTLQFIEVKISSKEPFGLRWPLQVYGYIAARDLVDYKRIIIFQRERDDCQTICEEFPYLSLTGPTRAVVLIDPVYFEVQLKIRGTGQSEDQDLISLAEPFDDYAPLDSSLFTCVYAGKTSKLELTFGHILMSVEAAVSMKVIRGSWPAGFLAVFTAKTASINDMAIVLLATGYDGFPLADNGMIKLQRHVVCAEIMEGEHLEVSASAEDVDGKRFGDALFFKPQECSKLRGTLTVDSCEIEVTVSWSRISW